MGLGKKLAIVFGAVVGAPVAAAALYLAFNHSVVHECDANPGYTGDAGAMVVRWNLPPLVGERTGKYAVAFLNRNQDVFYSIESDNREDLEEKANTFCHTGKLPDPAL